MEDDANEFGGWVLVLILVGVLVAGGIVAALRADADSTGASGGSPGSTTSAPSGTASHAAAPAPAPAGGPASDLSAVGVDAPPCTHLQTNRSADGQSELTYPVSDGDSTRCILKTGDHGDVVAALQRALINCAGQTLPDDGVFDSRTADVLAGVQLAKGGAGDGIYGPNTSRVLGWPWADVSSGDLNGRCSPAGATA
jgi:peptidoglycan hydrolase-like protein with peptidoglycan-binding domain